MSPTVPTFLLVLVTLADLLAYAVTRLQVRTLHARLDQLESRRGRLSDR